MRGRTRKPTALKIIAGTDQPCRRTPNEPKPARARLPVPAHLSAGAKAAWPAFAAVLDGMKVLTVADGFALGGLCEAFADVQNARAHLPADGSLDYETVNAAGGVMHRAWPAYAILSDADRRYAMWISKFGISPADRARVSAMVGDDAANPFAKLG